LRYPDKNIKFKDARILIFAKAPIEGQVKTRLIPDVGAEHTTQLYRLMLEQVVSTVVSSKLCPVTLVCTPDIEHEFFQILKNLYQIDLELQNGGNLGERMFHAAESGLKVSRRVVIIGTDCLQLTESMLGQVLATLSNGKCDAVVTPAIDGGYALIALNRNDPALFDDIQWGSEFVMQQTRTVLQRLGWNWQETDKIRDLDTIDDLIDVYKNKHQYYMNTGVQALVTSIVESRN